MKFLKFTLILILLSGYTGCRPSPETPKTSGETEFYIGTYSRDNSKGIYKGGISSEGKFSNPTPVAQLNNPSFIRKTANGRFLLSVSEQENGELLAFEIKGDTLIPVNSVPTFGAHPCHISILKNEKAVVSNYTGGNISLYDLASDGSLTHLDTIQFRSKGPHPRQEASHAHSSFFMGDQEIASADLGSDNIFLSRFNENEDQLFLQDSVTLEPGSGPRHIAIHPSRKFIYAINELNSTVTLLSKGDASGKWQPLQSISTLPQDHEGENYCADVHIDRTGNFLYASNRGHQSIAVFRIDPESGILTTVAVQSVHGAWPRNFAITPDNNFLIAANEHSGNLVSFKRDTINGTLQKIDELKIPAPVCIAF